MHPLQLRYWRFALAIAIASALVSISACSFANSSKSSRSEASLLLASNFEPPNDGAPGRREDAGSRPGCPQPDGKFTALIPATNLGKTSAEYPTFWLYAPYSTGRVELILEDEGTKQQVYKTRFQVQNTPGIMSYTLSNSAPALEEGKKYRWRFFFFCNPTSQSDVLAVNGVVIRETLTSQLRSQLQQASPHERLSLYAANGLWYDLVTELAQLHQAQPDNTELTQAWTNLLQHPMVQLNQLASVPVTACCKEQ